MFQRSRYPTSSSATQGTYTRIQQQDDYDDDYDDLVHELLHHPNSLIVTDELDSAIAPSLAQSPPPVIEDHHALAEDEDTSFSARASFSAKRAAEFPNATRQFIKSKLPFRKTMAAEASFASLPSVVMADIQQGDIPARSDPLHKELPKRGWTIVRRRRFRGRRRMRGHKKHVQMRAPLAFTDALSCTDPIYSSVFVKWTPEQNRQEQERPISPTIAKDHHSVIPVSKDDFATIMQSVRTAIDDNAIQPTRISQGSSGSYFCRNSQGKIVGVFKPKNEEPYGRLNPKWTKWIHRHLFPCCFGRSCLIPNLGYISEAASSLVDRRLGTNIVPFTEVVHLASPSFHYDYLDRRSAAVVGLPPKIGSFQCFLDGFKDANIFMREHPYPVESYSSSSLRLGRAGWAGCLGEQDEAEELESEGEEAQEMFVETAQSEAEHEAPQRQQQQRLLRAPSTAKFRWTHRLQDQFKLEFEQLVLLDYLIRNTDRGLDNWMLKYCGFDASGRSTPNSSSNASRVTLNDVREHVHLAAIDNGLAFPFKHPDQWRSYPYGWLALPESLVARPFSESTRNKYLATLSDPLWWQETVRQLRDLFHVDSDFDDRMFERQVAVLKGQGYNIVRCLSDPSGSPLDLVSLERVLVNQEEILIAYDEKIIRSRNPEAMPVEEVSSGRPGRLRTKRSTSFDLAMHRPYMDEEMRAGNDPQQATAPVPLTTWKQRMRNRISVDMSRRRRRRMMKNLRLSRRHVSSDGENEESDSSSEEDTKQTTIKCVTIIMETLEVVKSRPPYFTCC
ncbi:phosphatidylinositol 3 and 4-kinase-domain-containing protein [Syncephalastrum racemosum]|uniref:Phosphatidylinositol 4-kinase n=1 Tax=Syncephalastrum racemosum TaxID=13706 RepID=A0A1X2HEF7_SYNRA|nr:phosphatidylinositol 3 and 4-kinase-domain-containing protein [Syncephalastrum racemosum]